VTEEMRARLGWDPTWEQARRDLDPEAAMTAVRIVAEHRGAYHASDGDAVAWVELTGRAFHRARDKRALPTVGDWILVERWDDATAGKGAGVIRHVLPRRGLLVRKAAGEATAPQPIVANVDVGLVLTSANRDLSLPRLDRYVSLLRDGGIAPALVLSKVDLVADPAPLLARLVEIAPGAPILGVSVVTGEGLDDLRRLAGRGRTAVLLGSSGVGKSSLLNALLGVEAQTIRPIRADERGRHTTTHRELFVTDGGAWIDTPGMRELARWIERDEAAFDDIAALAADCRFRDCTHHAEPGCAVRAAIARGALAPDRLTSFHKLAGEREVGAKKQDAARRIAETRRAKARRYAPRPGKPDDDR
jgi:ribosome biogenesis GTPase / thiamine phosphate phosphatase